MELMKPYRCQKKTKSDGRNRACVKLLKKKGANWMACCPFHKEKTPSFSVSPAKEIFYCFGCHKGGSVFNFVMEIESVPFPEAIKIVADKSGVPLPKLIDDSRFEAKRQEADEG